ncbi:MAG: hypothetical protein HZB51_34090 [Chloroflexi bacterium]|nr:hypothetical protein [Chloroflexota bacterium]
MKWLNFRSFGSILKIVALFAFVFVFVAVPTASAQGNVPPAPSIPSLNELLAMTLGALGALVFVAFASYLWGWIVSAVLARLPLNVPTWVSDLLVAVPLAGLAAMWNAFSQFMNVTYPGVLDKTVGEALLWLANWLGALFFSRKGGLANAFDVSRWIRLRQVNNGVGVYTQAAAHDDAILARAQKAVLLFE